MNMTRFFFILTAAATTTLQFIQPAFGPACPGEGVILTCTVTSAQLPDTIAPTLTWTWRQLETGYSRVSYRDGAPLTAPLGDFTTTAVFSNNNYMIVSNATLRGALLAHNQKTVGCYSPPGLERTKNVTVAGI